jgi:hypothetical protein
MAHGISHAHPGYLKNRTVSNLSLLMSDDETGLLILPPRAFHALIFLIYGQLDVLELLVNPDAAVYSEKPAPITITFMGRKFSTGESLSSNEGGYS